MTLHFSIWALPSHTFMFTFDYMIYMYFTIAAIMSVFSSPTGSPGCPDLDQTYPMSISDDLREDALHDLLQ